jgi:hypothetical protein
MDAVLIILAMVIAAMLCVGGLAGVGVWLSVRAVRRSRLVNRGRLVIRSAAAGSRSGREAARLRVELYDAMAATARTLATVPAPAVLVDLAADVRRAAGQIDRRLGLLEGEPDRRMLERQLAPLGAQARALCSAAADLRETAWRFTDDLDRTRVHALTQEVADQVAGLRAGLAAVTGFSSQPV